MAWLAAAVAALALGGGAVLRQRSPAAYETRAPTQAWADGPMRLVAAPRGRDDVLTAAATHMALLHNALIRDYNSIVVQAPHVRDADKADFAGYAGAWLRFVRAHQDDEEAVLFPEVQAMLGDAGVWGDMYKEHESVLGGLDELSSYLGSLANASAWTPGALVAIMDSIREPLEQHLHHEVAVMAAMATHRNAPARDSPAGAVAAATLKAWVKKTVRKAGVADVVPLFLLNADGTAEGGAWRDWPPMPRAVRWALVNVVGAVHGGWWRFASCDARGEPRELHALAAEDGPAAESEP